jgi:hypothetical protein
MLRWAERHIDLVQVMVFILYRAIDTRSFDFYVGPRKLDADEFVYNDEQAERTDIDAEEIHALIRQEYPDFESCAYLNGTQRADSFKWLLSGRLGSGKTIYGYVGPKAMEMIQVFNHLFTGRYLGYSSPRTARSGRSMLWLGLFDQKLRRAARKFLANPLNAFTRLHYQSVMVIQPIDFLEDGRQNMCDGCPDVTVWNGQLVWSCRMDEQLKYGCNVTSHARPSCSRSSGCEGPRG